MKIYAMILMIFVLGLLVGCATEQTQSNDAPAEPTGASDIVETNSQPISNEPVITEANNESIITPKPTVPPSGISLTELASHDSREDCWIGYKGKVYDVTSYVPKHPGGAQQIIPLCGTASEFEKAFSRQHGTSKVNILEREGIFKGELQ